MKAISLWQPWASAVSLGAKRIETRSWATNYRGPLAIHASKRRHIHELIHIGSHWGWCGVLKPLGADMGGPFLWDILPFGAIVAVCQLVDCRPTGSFTNDELDTPRRPAGTKFDAYDWTERQLGDFSVGRFGWVLNDIRLLDKPIPFTGRQGLFNVPDELLENNTK